MAPLTKRNQATCQALHDSVLTQQIRSRERIQVISAVKLTMIYIIVGDEIFKFP